MAVHGKADLARAVGGAYPGALAPDPPPAESDLAGLVAVAHGSSLGVMAALGADDLGDLFFHQLGEATETDADRQRQEPLLGDAHQLPKRLLDAWRKRVLIARDGLRGRYVSLHGGSPFDLADRSEGSHWERTEQEDRRPQVLRATGQPRNDWGSPSWLPQILRISFICLFFRTLQRRDPHGSLLKKANRPLERQSGLRAPTRSDDLHWPHAHHRRLPVSLVGAG